MSGDPGRIYADQNYGGLFDFDKFYLNGRNASFVGHGGQRIIIDLDTGRVLTLHAITDDYDFQKMHDLSIRYRNPARRLVSRVYG